jgi:CBS domain-containing protein
MRVEDVMTREVATVHPDTPLRDVARLLVERAVSGVPVVNDDGAVVGIVSEADVMAKERREPQRTSALARWLDRDAEREELRFEARVAGEAMTSPVITIAPYTPITSAAERMAEQAINRLPVTSGDKLVGIVTRADLVRAFARSEKDVAQDVHDQLEFQRALTGDGEGVEATVVAGEVTLSGHMRRRTGAEGLPRIIRNIPGVINVRSELTWSEDT